MFQRLVRRFVAGLILIVALSAEFNQPSFGDAGSPGGSVEAVAGDAFDLQQFIDNFQQVGDKAAAAGPKAKMAGSGKAKSAISKSSKSAKASASSSSSGGKSFEGVININGKEVRTKDPKEFARLQRQMQTQMGPLAGLAQATAKTGNGGFEGVINVNGKEVRTKNPKEFERLQQRALEQMKAQMAQFPVIPQGFGQAGSSSSSAFSGVINNNGVVQEFENPAEFEQAQKQLLFPEVQ